MVFEGLLGELGYEGATIARISDAAGWNPGLVHHYFRDKDELVEELLSFLVEKLRVRLADARTRDAISDAALELGPRADLRAAKAWVGVFAEAMRRPDLARRLRRALGQLHRAVARTEPDEDAALAVVALTIGFLLLGAIDPSLTKGRAASIARRLELREERASDDALE